MDAPARAYMTDTERNFSRLLRCLVARFLLGSRSGGGYSASVESMYFFVLQIFSLNEVLLVRGESGGRQRLGFIGMVMSGSVNSARHNLQKRDSGVRLRLENGTEYILLSDAGLNTLPGNARIYSFGEGVSVNPSDCVIFENFRKIRFSLSSAFYGQSTYRLYAKKLTVDPWREVSSGTLDADASTTLEWEGDIPHSSAPAGTEFYLSARLEVSNSEGTVSDEAGPVLIRPAVRKITVYATDNRNEPWNTGTPMEVYIGERDYDAVHVMAPSSQSQLIPESSLPDGGKLWRLEGISGFVELWDGDYNLWAYSGVVYGSGRMLYIYRPNSETVEPHWRVVVGIEIQKYGTSDGWPEAASPGYMYRIAVTARYVAIAGITTPPPSAQVSGISVRAVNESGFPVGSLQIDRSSWDSGTVLSLSDSDRAVSSPTYMYAKDLPYMEKAYGVEVSAYEITPQDMESGTETAPLP